MNSKENDILELIKVSALQPEQIDALLPITVQQLTAQGKEITNIDQITLKAKDRILSEAFLKRFSAAFDSVFSHEEIKELIKYYKSEAMRKFHKNYSTTCYPIYPAFNEVVKEILAEKDI